MSGAGHHPELVAEVELPCETDDDEPSLKIDREGFLRIPKPLHGRWLDRCHREDVNPDDTAAIILERALKRNKKLTAEVNVDPN